jgi:hypothetical protein
MLWRVWCFCFNWLVVVWLRGGGREGDL